MREELLCGKNGSCGDSRPFDKLRAGSRLSNRAQLDSLEPAH